MCITNYDFDISKALTVLEAIRVEYICGQNSFICVAIFDYVTEHLRHSFKDENEMYAFAEYVKSFLYKNKPTLKNKFKKYVEFDLWCGDDTDEVQWWYHFRNPTRSRMIRANYLGDLIDSQRKSK